MLKDITLGQYFPGDTVVHRLDPRTKILLVTCRISWRCSAARVWLAYGLVALVLPVCVRISTGDGIQGTGAGAEAGGVHHPVYRPC